MERSCTKSSSRPPGVVQTCSRFDLDQILTQWSSPCASAFTRMSCLWICASGSGMAKFETIWNEICDFVLQGCTKGRENGIVIVGLDAAGKTTWLYRMIFSKLWSITSNLDICGWNSTTCWCRSGVTTFVAGLQKGCVVPTNPTIVSNYEEVEYRSVFSVLVG
jgi:hypothetical protein